MTGDGPANTTAGRLAREAIGFLLHERAAVDGDQGAGAARQLECVHARAVRGSSATMSMRQGTLQLSAFVQTIR